MSGVLGGIIGSVKAATAAVANKYFAAYSMRASVARVGAAEDSSGNHYLPVTGSNTLVKMGKDGAIVWSKSTNFAPTAAVADANGVYVVGTDGAMLYVAMFNHSGALQWSKKTTSIINAASSTLYGPRVENLSSTKLIVTANHHAVDAKDSDSWYIITVLKSDGSLQTAVTAGTGLATSVVADGSGNAWVSGVLGVGSAVLLVSSTGNTLVNQYSCTGAVYAMAVDPSGNLYLQNNADVTKVGTSRTVAWSKRFAKATYVTGYSAGLGVDSSGNTYVVPLSKSGESALFKLNTSGVVQWANSYVFSPATGGYTSVGVTSTGDVISNYATLTTKSKPAGTTFGTVSFGGTTLTYSAFTGYTVTDQTPSFSGASTYVLSNVLSAFGWAANTYTPTSGSVPSSIYTYA